MDLTISSLLFQKYTNTTYWKVLLIVETITNGFLLNGTSELIFKTNQLPFNGTCNINNQTGLALETYFKINCFDWIDIDGFIVSYAFYATYLGNTNPIGLDKNNNGNATFQLPNGPKEDFYKISLYVHIIDDSDGIFKYFLQEPVIVKTNDAMISNLANSFLSSDSSSLVGNLKSSDLQATSSFINSFASMLNSQSDSSGNSNASGVIVDEEQTKKNSKLKAILVDIMSSMPVTDINSVLLISNTLSSLTSNPKEINSNAAVIFC